MKNIELSNFFSNSKEELQKIVKDEEPTTAIELLKVWKEKLLMKLSDVDKIKIKNLELIYDSDPQNIRVPIDLRLMPNELELQKANTLLNDMIFKYSCDTAIKENIEALKLLKAREENIDFELQLAEMICGDHPNSFPYRSSMYLTQFFHNLGYNFMHNGETRRYWVRDRLFGLDIKEIHKLISEGLFKKKYFNDYAKREEPLADADYMFKNATKEFKDFIQSSISMNEVFDLSSVLDMSVNIELLFDNVSNTSDKKLNELIEEAKERFFNPKDKQVALEKLWDAFERIKTFFSDEGLKKNQSADKLVSIISEQFNKEFIDKEFSELTKIGNDYRIRHHETNRKELTPIHVNYFFFRMLSLIDLCLGFLHEEEPNEVDLY